MSNIEQARIYAANGKIVRDDATKWVERGVDTMYQAIRMTL